MDDRETRAMMEDVAAVMKSLVTNAVSPIVSRLDALEKRLADIPAPKDGKDADPDAVAAMVAANIRKDFDELRSVVDAIPALPDIPAMVADAVKAIPAPKDGASITLDDVAPMIKAAVGNAVEDIPRAIAQTVEDAIAAIPPAADGKDADPELIKQMVADAVAALPPAEKGKDADPVEVAALVTQAAERILAGWDKPQDGKSITIDDVRPLIDEAVTKAVAIIPVPKDGRDGIDVKDLLVVEGGDLVATFTDGRTKVLGPFRGKDADIEPLERTIAERLAALPVTKEIDQSVVARFVSEELARISKDGPAEFAPDDVASNISSAIKMMAERPLPQVVEAAATGQPSPTINIALSDNREPPTVNLSMPDQPAPVVNVAAPVVNVSPPNVNIEAKRSKEVTTVTGYDKNGRIKSFEKTEVDE